MTALVPAAGATLPGAVPARPTPPSGPILFARYAYGPNRLGYCGPEDSAELLEQAAVGREEPALRVLARGFEGAYPYLELIASANGIADPLDRRVVEAYWLGNRLLEAVTPGLLGRSLEGRFRPRLRPEGWRWLATKPDDGARPVHAFHVLDVFPRLGLMRTGSLDRALEVMDSCRIRWGTVEGRTGDWLLVRSSHLELVDGRLRLAEPRLDRVRGWRDGLGFLEPVKDGEVVSVHWDWACDRLDDRQLRNLVRWTRRELEIANRTI